MGKLPANFRLPEETVAWVKSYAKERGCSQAEVIEMAVASLKGDAAGGVPDLVDEPPAPKPAAKAKPAPGQVVRARDLVPPVSNEAVMRARQARLSKQMGWS